MNSDKKEKLKGILDMISDDSDKSEGITVEKLNKLSKFLEDFSNDMKTKSESTNKEIQELKKKIKPADYSEMLDALREISGRVGMIKLQERVDKDYSVAYKLMLEQLSGINNKIGGWKYPQYAYTGIRNKGFSPIDPANNGIGVPDYDSFTLTLTSATVETYRFFTGGISGPSSVLVATVTITYTDSTKNNILNVVRT
jgi:hypothetical protein